MVCGDPTPQDSPSMPEKMVLPQCPSTGEPGEQAGCRLLSACAGGVRATRPQKFPLYACHICSNAPGLGPRQLPPGHQPTQVHQSNLYLSKMQIIQITDITQSWSRHISGIPVKVCSLELPYPNGQLLFSEGGRQSQERKERRRHEGKLRKRLFQRSYFILFHFTIYFYEVIRSVFSKPNAWLCFGVLKIYSAIYWRERQFFI